MSRLAYPLHLATQPHPQSRAHRTRIRIRICVEMWICGYVDSGAEMGFACVPNGFVVSHRLPLSEGGLVRVSFA